MDQQIFCSVSSWNTLTLIVASHIVIFHFFPMYEKLFKLQLKEGEDGKFGWKQHQLELFCRYLRTGVPPLAMTRLV